MTSMRLAMLTIFAVVTCGCSVHIVEAPAAAPTYVVAEARQPERVQAESPRHSPPPRPRDTRTRPRPAPATRAEAPAAPVTRRPARVPFKATKPEPRPHELAGVAPPPRRRRPMKVKLPEPVSQSASAGFAKAQ